MTRSVRDLSVGDIFHGRYPNGAIVLAEVVGISDDFVKASRLWLGDRINVSRQDGEEVNEHPSYARAVIDSVAILSPDVHRVLRERHARFTEWASRQHPEGGAFDETVDERAAVEAAVETFRRNPLHHRVPGEVSLLVSQVEDTAISDEERGAAAYTLGRYDFPEVEAQLVRFASDTQLPESISFGAARGLAGLWSDKVRVDNELLGSLPDNVQAEIRERIPWVISR